MKYWLLKQPTKENATIKYGYFLGLKSHYFISIGMRVVKVDFNLYICTKGITCIADHILLCIWTVLSARVLYANKKRNKKLWFHFLLLFVGVAGFEPTTPCSQSRCANRTALHPVFLKNGAKVILFFSPTKLSSYFCKKN